MAALVHHASNDGSGTLGGTDGTRRLAVGVVELPLDTVALPPGNQGAAVRCIQGQYAGAHSSLARCFGLSRRQGVALSIQSCEINVASGWPDHREAVSIPGNGVIGHGTRINLP